MPAVQRQSNVARQPPPKAAGNAWDLIDKLRVLVYGESGTGKTTFWSSFPGPILCLLCSGGKKPGELRSIDTPEMRKKVTPVIIQSFEEARRELANARDYATVVLDHASGFSDLILSAIIGKPVPEQKGWGLASQQQYGQMALQCKEAFREMLDLPCNVVFIAQQRTFGGKDDGMDEALLKPTVGAALTPSLTGWLNPACDYVVQTFKRPKMKKITRKVGDKSIETWEKVGGVEYCLRTEPHEVFMTKFRVPKGSPLPDCIVDPTYDKMVALMKGR